MKVKYVADNGREFDTKEACEKYEAKAKANTVWVVSWDERGMGGKRHRIGGVFSTRELAESYVKNLCTPVDKHWNYNIHNYVLNEPD